MRKSASSAMWTLSARDCVSERIAAVSPVLTAQRSKTSQNASIHFPSMRSESMRVSSSNKVLILRSAPSWGARLEGYIATRCHPSRSRATARLLRMRFVFAALLHRRDDGRVLELRYVHLLRQHPGVGVGIEHGLDCGKVRRS